MKLIKIRWWEYIYTFFESLYMIIKYKGIKNAHKAVDKETEDLKRKIRLLR